MATDLRILLLCLGFLVTPLLAAPEAGRPNLLLVMADDLGYADIGCYGSEIDTPVLDALAAQGLRFTHFYNAGRCCPTRAALLTGLYPHQAGVGKMVAGTPAKTPHPNQGYLNQECVTLAEVLQPSGYRCYMSGKWHVGEFRPAWPVDRGFDHYYGLISGAMNYFDLTKAKRPGLKRVFARDGQRLLKTDEEFYSTDAFATQALAMLEAHERDYTETPFFLYLAFNAPHWPLHASPKLIQKYAGRYREGWAAVRQNRYQCMIQQGLIDPAWKMSPADARDWDALTDLQKVEMDQRMAVYAAMVERMDWNLGRVIEHLKQRGDLDNTVVLFLSDNGACHEGGMLGGDMRKDLRGPTGTVDSYRTYGRSWSNVGNTPFRKHKHWMHEGGIATPLIVHWPRGLKTAAGSLNAQPGHVIDIMPTFCELSGATYPQTKNGHAVTPQVGRSLVPCLQGIQDQEERTLYWEHMGHAAIRQGNWKMVRVNKKPWELYDLQADRTELEDRAGEEPERIAKLSADWRAWAAGVGVSNVSLATPGRRGGR